MRIIDVAGAALVLVGLGLAAVVLAPGETVSGAVLVVDGDSLRIGGRNIRLSGIDAPELHQTCLREGRSWPCGEAARQGLRRLVGDADIACAISGRDRYGRSLARCGAGERDLGAAMIGEGLAVAYGGYEAEERAARDKGAGLWAGPFERPSDWRKQHPRPLVAQVAEGGSPSTRD